ncbi:MAG TPA: HD-GYP domain-containing protein [Vicinamibacterales bacterium]|nr:HD-GYP domain-containing protein [Vicinamibacterales bacterium]
MEVGERLALYEDLLRRLAAAVRGAQLYAPGHPLTARNVEALAAVVLRLHAVHPSLTAGVVGDELVVADTPLPKVSAQMGDFLRRLKSLGIERIQIDRGAGAEEIQRFVELVAQARPGEPALNERLAGFPHIRVGRIAEDEQAPDDGVRGDIAQIRRLYSAAVEAAEQIWESAATEGIPDAGIAVRTVDGLAEAVAQNRTAVIALTAMKTYDNYTFTHMVNVSILAMSQARALGIDGRLLREFGLSALMHDIGKVRTPHEILNKPERLTDAELAVMRRHTVEGAEMLRRTPEMPVLAPVVAFEHHLRLDGSGYPEGVRRDALNLGTQLTSIADVFDAMRSQRVYQQSFPSDRILAVLKKEDGRQFDRHLVRRFAQLMGVYPPGNLVRLTTGELAVVLKVHALDPERPRVRVLTRPDGERLEVPIDRNLWEAVGPDGRPAGIAAPLDPADYGIDPLQFLG